MTRSVAYGVEDIRGYQIMPAGAEKMMSENGKIVPGNTAQGSPRCAARRPRTGHVGSNSAGQAYVRHTPPCSSTPAHTLDPTSHDHIPSYPCAIHHVLSFSSLLTLISFRTKESSSCLAHSCCACPHSEIARPCCSPTLPIRVL